MSLRSELELDLKVITFPRLRELRGKHNKTYEELATVIGVISHSTFMRKLEFGFTMTEMFILVRYFNLLGENETVESLFFDWIYSNEKIKACKAE